ncbi:MAG: maleylpyruvate isomerase N-terminal domain-containing protein, partial [Gemmatimonadales bacterium]
MDTPESRLAALQAEAQQLTQYLTTLPPEAWSHPSACTRWQVADVVAHVATAGLLFTESLTRGLQGDSSPPAGWVPGGARDEDAFAEELAQRAIASRRQLGEQLLATFIQGNTALHQLLTGLTPHDWATVCYHPAGPRTVWAMVEARTTELAMHGWDIRSQLEPIAHLS